jgi:hypothetical protein
MAQQLRERIDKQDYRQLKTLCTTKEMITILKKQPTKWEKIFASYTSEEGLITRIYRELKKLNSQKIKRSTSLAIQKMQIKTTLRFHLTPVRMATIKNTNNYKCW